MNTIWVIVRKEMKRVFTDFRVILSLFIIPPLTIFVIYGLMGWGAQQQMNREQEYIPKVIIVHPPSKTEQGSPSLKTFFNNLPNLKADIEWLDSIDDESLRDYQLAIEEGEFDLLIQFPLQFIQMVENYQRPQIQIHYNINRSYSGQTRTTFLTYLSQYEKQLLKERIDLDDLIVFDRESVKIGDPEKAAGSTLAMILPLLIIIFLMSMALSVGIESIAGEKERGTMATLLVTPIKRSSIVVGKIISVSILGVLSSLTSFIGILGTLPIFVLMMEPEQIPTNQDVMGGILGGYTISHVLMLLLIMVVAVLFFVSLVLLVSTYAKSIKEANALIMPLYLVVIGIAMFTMFSEEVSTNAPTYVIPIYNLIVGLKAILMFEMTNIHFILTVVSTILYTISIIFIIQRLFGNEKIMFDK